MELERDFTFSLTKYPSLIFVFLVVQRNHTKLTSEMKNVPTYKYLFMSYKF